MSRSPLITPEFVCSKPYGLLHFPIRWFAYCLFVLLYSFLFSCLLPESSFSKFLTMSFFSLRIFFKFHIICQTEPNSLTWLIRLITQSVYPPHKLQPPRINESFIKMSCSFQPSPMAWEAFSSLFEL